MSMHSYRDLRVWQTAMQLVAAVYKLTTLLPATERFALADQIKRSAVSIPANIAEGQRRFGDAETAHFCSIALGSLGELETQLLLVKNIYNLSIDAELKACEDVGKMLSGLSRAMREGKGKKDSYTHKSNFSFQKSRA